jgi:hypothetical protein
MDTTSKLKIQLKDLATPGEGMPSLNAWKSLFLAKQSAIKSEAWAVLNGCEPMRLALLIKEAEQWPAVAQTCSLALQVLELAGNPAETTNNKTAQ